MTELHLMYRVGAQVKTLNNLKVVVRWMIVACQARRNIRANGAFPPGIERC